MLRDRIAELFAERHELDPSDVEVGGGSGAARAACPRRPGISRGSPQLTDDHVEVLADFAIPDGGWTQATHCCWVEVDVNTGMVSIPRHLVVEDCGTMINPTIVEGQVSGGVAQGLSTVLYERFVYDDDGQPRAITLLDYLLPTAAEIPDIEIEHLESPPQGPINFRGAGGERRGRRAGGTLERDRRRSRPVWGANHPKVPVAGSDPGSRRQFSVTRGRLVR